MRKIIRKTGGSLAIVFNVEDVKVYQLKEGDTVDIEICKVLSLKK